MRSKESVVLSIDPHGHPLISGFIMLPTLAALTALATWRAARCAPWRLWGGGHHRSWHRIWHWTLHRARTSLAAHAILRKGWKEHFYSWARRVEAAAAWAAHFHQCSWTAG